MASATDDADVRGGGGQAGSSRILGAARSMEDVLLSYHSMNREEGVAVVKQVCGGGGGTSTTLSLYDLEKAIRVFTNHNSAYVDVEQQDFALLAEEVLNNAILSILVFAGHSPRIGDFEICSLSRAMQYNLSVEALTLSGLNVSDEAISLLCEALIHSRVSFIDLSNTPLEDEAGRSIAALAHVSPYLRTVVVTATLIAEEIQDEIDVACQFNQSNFEGNDNKIDESVFRDGDVGRLKQRLVQVIRVKERKTMLCVAHLFECCPNGELCLYSHDLRLTTADPQQQQRFQKALAEMFASGQEGWEDALPARPQEGASWKPPEERDEAGYAVVSSSASSSALPPHGACRGPRINLDRRLAVKREQEAARQRAAARQRWVRQVVLPCSALAMGLSVLTLGWVWARGKR